VGKQSAGRWILELPEGEYHELRDMRAAAEAPVMIARGFADLSQRLYSGATTEDVIETILAHAVAGLAGCDYAGVSLAHRGGRIDTPVSTDNRALRLDELQYRLREGPCVHAIWKNRSFSVPDLAEDVRWPRYGPAAAEHGARAMLAYRLYTEDRGLGALNLYSTRVNGFTEADEQLGLLLAAHAAVAIDAARTRTQLRGAIDSRQVIGEAIGILKERHQYTSQEAFDRLSTASQRLNVKLREIARQVSSTGEEPDQIGVG
jgi:GAF domain-containing protein